MTDKQWEKKVEGIVFGGHVDTAPMDSEYVNRLQAEVERLTATCNYAVKELAFLDCGSAPLEELARRAKAEVERLKAAFGPTIELLQHIEWDFEYAAIHKTELVLTQKSDRPALQRELARLKAIVEKGTE
jgi:uncharacterized small protein (DUF1192 family)